MEILFLSLLEWVLCVNSSPLKNAQGICKYLNVYETNKELIEEEHHMNVLVYLGSYKNTIDWVAYNKRNLFSQF